MKSYYILILFISIFFAVFAAAQGDAQEDPFAELTYPIPELGNCQNKDDCMIFCDNPDNAIACLDYAQSHNLLPPEDIKMAREMLALGEVSGPGGCKGKAECDAYCDDINHIEECLDFAQEHNLIPPEELQEAKKVAQAIKQGIKPPNCKSKTECDIYCSRPENMGECIAFGEAAGLIPPEELAEAKMVLKALRKGAKPPPCRNKEECDIYCDQPEHLEECISFALAAGFMTPEEAEMVRKTGGKGPGDCRGEAECKAYCDNPANAEQCLNFAIKYGLIPPEEAEQAKKMLELGLTAGPGGCQSHEECDAYCEKPEHMVECVEFGVKMGLVPPEEAEKAKRMAELGITGGPGGCQSEQECRMFCDNPENARECIEFGVKIGEMSPQEAEKMIKMMEQMQKGGPGGCQTEQECRVYCDEPVHMEECLNFAVEIGEKTPEDVREIHRSMESAPKAGPGGCRTDEECNLYCSDPANLEECMQFSPGEGKAIPGEMAPMMEMKGQEMMRPGMEQMMKPQEQEQGQGQGQGPMPEKEIEMAPKQTGPGGCQTETACATYCSDPAHLRDCVNFYVATRKMTPQEGQKALNLGRIRWLQPEAEPSEPEPSKEPQSLLDQAINFLANLAAAFGF